MVYEERWKLILLILTTILLFQLRSKLVSLNQVHSAFMLFLFSDAECFLWKPFTSSSVTHRQIHLYSSPVLSFLPSCADEDDTLI